MTVRAAVSWCAEAAACQDHAHDDHQKTTEKSDGCLQTAVPFEDHAHSPEGRCGEGKVEEQDDDHRGESPASRPFPLRIGLLGNGRGPRTTIAAKALRRDCRSAEFARYMFSTPMGATYARPMPSPCARGRMMIGSMSVSCPCSLPVSYVPASVVLGRDDADAPRRWAVLHFLAYP